MLTSALISTFLIHLFLIHSLLSSISSKESTPSTLQNNNSLQNTTSSNRTFTTDGPNITATTQSYLEYLLNRTEYNDYLTFQINGFFMKNFTRELNNQSSQVYQDVVTLITQKITSKLSSYQLKEVVIYKLRPGSIRFDGLLYFNQTEWDVTEWDVVNRVNTVTDFSNVTAIVICTSSTCNRKGICISVQHRNTSSICRCELGYRGYQCQIPYPVDGVVQSWSIWSTCSRSCGNGTHSRFRYCDPEPFNGGVCTNNNKGLIDTKYCFLERCERNHSDDDYIMVAYICGAILIIILILLIAFCCIQKMEVGGRKNKESYSVHKKFDAIEAYRVPSVVKRPSKLVQTDETQQNVIPLHLRKHKKESKKNGKENHGFNDEDMEEFFNEDETIYKKQLDKFLKDAPQLRSSDVSASGAADMIHYDEEPSIKNKPTKKLRAKRPKTPNEKVVSRGPENYELVMM